MNHPLEPFSQIDELAEPGRANQLGRNRRLLSNHQSTSALLQFAADLGITLALLIGLTLYKEGDFDSHYRVLAAITALTMTVIYFGKGLYRRSVRHWKGALRLATLWGSVLTVLLLLAFVTKMSAHYSREIILLWAASAYVGQWGSHRLAEMFTLKRKAKGIGNLPTLVLGDGQTAKHLIQALDANPWMPEKVIGCISPSDEMALNGLHIIGGLESIPDLVSLYGIKRIYIALPMEDSALVERLQLDLMDSPVDVIWAPDIYALRLLNHSVREVAGIPLISISESPLTSASSAMVAKRVMDVVGASLGLILLSPLMLWVAFMVKRSSPGPVLFKQKRHGWDGEIIEVWKFRSMKAHVEDEGKVTQATLDDPRVTPIGKFLRRTSIDELPQLFNVLQGTISLVGPRPHAVEHNDYYISKIRSYFARHRIKPGITGLAQISGCRGETQTLYKMTKRLEYDLKYINEWSLENDIKILVKTPFTLFSKGIY